MKKIIVDSSVIIKWLHKENERYLYQASKILEDVKNGTVTLLVPELAKYEVGNALLFGKKLSTDQAKIPLAAFYLLPIQFTVQSEQSAILTYEIAEEENITYYDASFIALAHQENAILVTDNPKHQGKDKEVKVIPLSQYGEKE